MRSLGGPNAQQVEYWNTQGARWVEVGPRIDAQLEPLGLATIERAAVRVGERVLDVGCGCGQATLQLAERVGATGSVLGSDISEPMLARARERAGEAGLENVEFRQGDAQTEPFPESHFDLIFSRYGVMFFADSEAAFANLRVALRPGGRLVFVCWQELGKNPWLEQPLGAALVEERAAKGRPGVLTHGSSYLNLFSGDAERSVFTLSTFATLLGKFALQEKHSMMHFSKKPSSCSTRAGLPKTMPSLIARTALSRK